MNFELEKQWRSLQLKLGEKIGESPEIDSILFVIGLQELNMEIDKLTKDHLVVSNASCTTNCLAPIAMVINQGVGISQGFMTTIHSYTGDQPTLDTMHSDMYRARAAAGNMIPTSTGAAKAVGLVLPELNGKLDGVSMRVPTQNVSVVDFKFNAMKSTSVEEINNLIKKASDNVLKSRIVF